MQIYLWIALGSAIGGMARYWCSGASALLLGETFPWGTLIVNVVGSLIIGSAVEFAGYTGMFFILSAVQAAGLIFVLLNAAKLRAGVDEHARADA